MPAITEGYMASFLFCFDWWSAAARESPVVLTFIMTRHYFFVCVSVNQVFFYCLLRMSSDPSAWRSLRWSGSIVMRMRRECLLMFWFDNKYHFHIQYNVIFLQEQNFFIHHYGSSCNNFVAGSGISSTWYLIMPWPVGKQGACVAPVRHAIPAFMDDVILLYTHIFCTTFYMDTVVFYVAEDLNFIYFH